MAAQKVKAYRVRAAFEENIVRWTFFVQTEDGAENELPIRDAEEIPLLLDICRRCESLRFDPEKRTLQSEAVGPGGAKN